VTVDAKGIHDAHNGGGSLPLLVPVVCAAGTPMNLMRSCSTGVRC
jgi:hypothetical protein